MTTDVRHLRRLTIALFVVARRVGRAGQRPVQRQFRCRRRRELPRRVRRRLVERRPACHDQLRVDRHPRQRHRPRRRSRHREEAPVRSCAACSARRRSTASASRALPIRYEAETHDHARVRVQRSALPRRRAGVDRGPVRHLALRLRVRLPLQEPRLRRRALRPEVHRRRRRAEQPRRPRIRQGRRPNPDHRRRVPRLPGEEPVHQRRGQLLQDPAEPQRQLPRPLPGLGFQRHLQLHQQHRRRFGCARSTCSTRWRRTAATWCSRAGDFGGVVRF